MVRNCSVCGNPDISLYWSRPCTEQAYCSFGCSLIGRAGWNLFFGIVSFIVTIISVVIYIADPVRFDAAIISVIFFGITTLITALLSGFGFFLRRTS